ncbi:MAG: hypothetical protein JO054_13835, partial [Actinobacteria bacterium]|nr:hypothetical protein [Actinomycetota bacterium]
MSVATLTAPVSLRRPTLGRGHLLLLAAATFLVTLGLFAVTPLNGVADFIVVF